MNVQYAQSNTFSKYALLAAVSALVIVGGTYVLSTHFNVQITPVAQAFGGDGGGDGGGGGGEGGGCGGCGDGGGGGNGGSDDNGRDGSGDPVVPASCDALTASQTAVPHGGAMVTLSWRTSNANHVTIDHTVGRVAADGSQAVWVGFTKTFTLRASGPGPIDTCRVTVSVATAPAPNPTPDPVRCESLQASRTTVPSGGGDVTFTWRTSGGTSVMANSPSIGNEPIPATGSDTVYIRGSETVRVTATGPGGSDSCSVSIREEVSHPPTCNFSASPTSVAPGERVQLAWTTVNTTALSINQGVGPVTGNFGGRGYGSTYVYPQSNTTYTLTGTGPGGTVTCHQRVTVEQPTPAPSAPTCDAFSASPNVLSTGSYVTLLWQTSNATGVSISQGVGSVSADGSRSVYVGASKTFVLTASGPGGSDTCSVPVTVQTTPPPPPPQQAPTCDAFTASPSSVSHGGGNTTLSWQTSNATGVSISGIGNVSIDGSRGVSVSSATTYTLTASGPGGTATCQTSVSVAAPNAPTCDAFSVSPSEFNNGSGGSVALSWNTTNADSVSINQGVGSVSADGSATRNVSQTTTYTLTASGGGQSVTCSDTVVVNDAPSGNLSCDFFDASDNTVEEDEDFTLSWGTTGATNVSINRGIGSVSDDGSVTTSVDNDTTFTLTAANGSDTVTCSETVYVDEDEDDDVSCDLDISDDDIDEGDSVRLSWDNRDADEILLEDDHGNVIIDTDEGDDYDPEDDRITLRPTEDTEYRLTVYGEHGGRERCEVDVEVDEYEPVASISRTQPPLVAGIALTDVPYTGFEAGPALTALFYTLLAVWGVGVAYLLVFKRDMLLSFLGTRENVREATPMFAPVSVYGGASTPISTEDVPVVPGVVEKDVADTPTEEDTIAGIIAGEAEEERVLLSLEATELVRRQAGTLEGQLVFLRRVIASAREQFPTEDGWLIVNKERILQLLHREQLG